MFICISILVIFHVVSSLFYERSFMENPHRDWYLIMVGILGGIIVPYLMITTRFSIEVNEDCLLIYSWPGFPIRKRIARQDLLKCKIDIDFDYIRSPTYLESNVKHFEHNWVKINSVVILEFESGKKIIIHSRDPEELSKVLSKIQQ